MAQIEVRTGLQEYGGEAALYAVADRRLLTDARTAAIRPFALQETVSWSEAGPQPARKATSEDALTFEGSGWIANAWRAATCRRGQDGYDLIVDGLGRFWIAESGDRVFLTDAESSCPRDLLAQASLGTPLLLALALQGVFSLHVSAVAAGDQLVAFAAESGQGKSTLARYLGFESGLDWRRICDDTLPAAINEAGGIDALPHFPQLKLADAHQPANLAPPRMPLSVLYVLDSAKAQPASTVAIEALSPAAATLAVVQHTVAGRLFDKELMQAHLAFGEAAARDVEVRSLTYPRVKEALPAVRDALLEDLGVRV